MAKSNKELWLEKYPFGYYNTEKDKGTGAEVIDSSRPTFDDYDDDSSDFDIDWDEYERSLDIDSDMSDEEADYFHSNLYGGDRTYCPDCGNKLTYGEDGYSYCPDCNARAENDWGRKTEDYEEDRDEDLVALDEAYLKESREVTTLVLDMIEDGMVSAEDVARMCLNYLSEEDAEDIANTLLDGEVDTYGDVRQYTNALIDLCEEGSLSWDTLVNECLQYMSEDDVSDMAHSNELIDDDEEERESVDTAELADNFKDFLIENGYREDCVTVNNKWDGWDIVTCKDDGYGEITVEFVEDDGDFEIYISDSFLFATDYDDLVDVFKEDVIPYIEYEDGEGDLEEGWTRFEYASGANPYIAKTEEEKKRICNKYGKNCVFKGNVNGNDHYVINDKTVENDFAPGDDLEESIKSPGAVNNALNKFRREAHPTSDLDTMKRNAIKAAERDGYNQLIVKDDDGSYSIVREYPGSTDNREVVGKATVSYKGGVAQVDYKELKESYGVVKDIINATNVMDVDSWKLALEREYPAPTEDVKKQRQANFGKAVGAFDTIKIPGQWYLYTAYCDFDVNSVQISDSRGSNNVGKTPKELSDRMQRFWIEEDKYELVLDTCDDNLSVDDIGVRIFKGKLPKDANGKRQCWEYLVYIVRFENRERYDTHYFTDSLHREVKLSESILTSSGYVTPSEGAVEQFLNKYGFGDDRYQKDVYTDNASKGKEIIASFVDGINSADYRRISNKAKEFFGQCPVEVRLGKEHKDGEDLWATLVFDFGRCSNREPLQEGWEPAEDYHIDWLPVGTLIKFDGVRWDGETQTTEAYFIGCSDNEHCIKVTYDEEDRFDTETRNYANIDREWVTEVYYEEAVWGRVADDYENDDEEEDFDESLNEALGGDAVEKFLSSKVVTVDGVTGIDPKAVNRNTMPRGCYITSSSLLGGRVYDHGTIHWKGADYVFRVKKDGSVKVMTDAQAGSNWSETIFKESKQLNEGPGAGYTLSGKLKITKVESLTPVKFEDADYGSYDVTFNCVALGTIEDFEFYSYMYGDKMDSAEVEISAIKTNFYAEHIDDIEALVRNNLEEVKDCLVGATVHLEYVYGAGWLHSKFDGTIAEIDDTVKDSDIVYGDTFDIEVFEFDAKIKDTDVIEYVDKAVSGGNFSYMYTVIDEDGNPGDAFFEKDDAIEYAKKNNCQAVDKTECKELFGGDTEWLDSEIIWERDSEEDFE